MLLSDKEEWKPAVIWRRLRNVKPKITYKAVYNALYRLRKRGLIERTKYGFYRLTSPHGGLGVEQPSTTEPLSQHEKNKDPQLEKNRHPQHKDDSTNKKVKVKIGLSAVLLWAKAPKLTLRRKWSLELRPGLEATVEPAYRSKTLTIRIACTDDPMDLSDLLRMDAFVRTIARQNGITTADIVVKQAEIVNDFEKRLFSTPLSYDAFTRELRIRVYNHRLDQTRAELRLNTISVPYDQAVSFVQQILQGGVSMLHLYQATYLALREHSTWREHTDRLAGILTKVASSLERILGGAG